MRMSQGVEWALHCCLNLAWTGTPVPASRLAALYDLPPAYLNKQLQALDEYEGDEYRRVFVEDAATGGFWLWKWLKPVDDLPAIESGDWVEYAASLD